MSLVLIGGVWGGDVAPDLADGPEGLRWNSVVPLPLDQQAGTGVWSAPRTILVSWGPVVGTERDDLADRLDRTLEPLGRTWRPVRPAEKADLSFDTQGGEGEGYRLQIRSSEVVIGAQEPEGRYYGLVSLAQLLPPRARPVELVTAATGVLVDTPAFSWRGLMLDSSRHFQSVETLEWVLELMALHKLNRFHWHLTDDQGWRLEIPGWPRLTQVGGWRTEADHRVGGSYSAADVRRVVAFAARRHIVVIPEIDLPGHASAALAAYPELSASGNPREVPSDWTVSNGVLSIGRASVETLTTDVLATLLDLFPGPWIHWGGDEVYRSPWMKNAESLRWMKKVGAETADEALGVFWASLAQKTLDAGRIPIGWDEVSRYPIPPGTMVQWWDDSSRALAALQSGHPVIASAKETNYLDYPEWAGDADRASWMPIQPVNKVVSQPFWPPGTTQAAKKQVWGLEAGLWTERAPEPKLGRKLFPRLALIAELAWRGVSGGAPGWQRRLAEHRSRLEAWGVGMLPLVQ